MNGKKARQLNSKNIKTDYGTSGKVTQLTKGCRHYYYHELKSNYKWRMSNEK